MDELIQGQKGNYARSHDGVLELWCAGGGVVRKLDGVPSM